MSIEALEARILETGADEDYAVLGDLLEQRGDPRGKLIALQRTRFHSLDWREYLEEHPELATEEVDLYWHHGYWSLVAIVRDTTDLAALLAHPSARLLRTIRFYHPLSRAADACTATLERSPGPVVDGIALDALGRLLRVDRDGAAWLPALAEMQRLRLGVRSLSIREHSISETGEDIGRLRGLTELHLAAAPTVPESITHHAFLALAPLAESLVTLTVENCRTFDDDVCAMLATFDHLEELHISNTSATERGLSLLSPRVRVSR